MSTKKIQQQLLGLLHQDSYLKDSLEYVIKVGGKRFRPRLTYASAELFNITENKIIAAASAVELIHIYSLIHDDLPEMDDDDIRHSHPSCHKKFDEATAVLTGDMLQTLAFKSIADDKNITDKQKILMIQKLAEFSKQMVDGQMLDLLSDNKKISIDTLKTMHSLKTGALLRCSISLGALSNEHISIEDLNDLDDIAKCIGLAYQIQDDFLEATSTSNKLGKSNTSDINNYKTTFITILGADKAVVEFNILYSNALKKLKILDNGKSELRCVIEQMHQRLF